MKANITLPIIFLLAIVSVSVNAQKDPIRWGKILPEDIKLQTYPADPNASAVILCDYGTVSAGPVARYTRHVRIKVLKNEGIAAATVEIPYKSYDHYENFLLVKGQTFNFNEKGVVIRSKLKRSTIQDIPIDLRHSKLVFTLPDVKVGSIFEYEYTLNSLDFVRMNNWYFQNRYPTLWSEFHVYIPRHLNYLVTFQKGQGINEQEQRSFADKIQWLYDTRMTSVYSTIYKNNYLLYESPDKVIKSYLISGEDLRFVMNDMPAIHSASKEPFIDLIPKVKIHLFLAEGPFPYFFRPILNASQKEYEAWERSDLSWNYQGFVAYELPTWEEATQKWLEDDHLGQRISKPNIAINSNGTVEQMESIFSFVKKNVAWNGSYTMYADRKLKDVAKSGSGSSGEINLMLIDLLQNAGFDVTPVLVRTHELGRVENIFPERSQFNHIIAQVTVKGQIFYLDATTKGSMLDLPENVKGTVGWLLKIKGFGWVDIQNGIQKEDTKSDSTKTEYTFLP